MDKIYVYLSGPMYLGWEQASEWRDEVTQLLKPYEEFVVINPCARWLTKGPELTESGSWVVQMDKMEIAKSNVLIVNATNPGWGTPMEQYIGYTTGKFIIAFSDCEHPSIWAKEHSHKLVKTHVDAAMFLIQIMPHLLRVI